MRFRIVLVPFPFDDFSDIKVRPAVCLTEATGVYQHIVLAFITSVVPAHFAPTDVLLDPRRPDFASTGLKVRSVVRLHRMLTVPARIIQRQLGVLTPSLQIEMKQRLRQLLDL